jgi:CTP:molybdopterin cytidylyltransferase MocA
MGSPKALLRAGTETFLARIARTLVAAGVDDVVVVTGRSHDDLVREVCTWPASWPVRIVRNETPGADQVSSLLCGLAVVDHPALAGILVALVDHPFVSADTIRALLRRFAETRAPIVRPVYEARHGHPVIFEREAFDALRRAPAGEGAKAVVNAFLGRAIDVEAGDEGTRTDVDTPEQYRAALVRFGLEPCEPS